jgi:hypothetical protein
VDFDILGQLEQSFNTKPVSIIEFAESKKYCGAVLYPRQRLLLKLIFLEDLTDEEERILDFWLAGGDNNEIEICQGIREKRAWLKANGYKHFREIVLVGGRRCSKGFITGLSMAKKLFDTVNLKDPHKHYKIHAEKPILFSCIAASQQQAQEMQYSDFSGMVNSCQALQPYIAKMQELNFGVYTETDLMQLSSFKAQGRRVQKDTSKIRGNALPANSRTIRGSATMVYTFDEFAHFMQGESDQSDKEVYAAAVPSLAQFGRDAMIFCNSSPYSKTGTFYERFEAGMETSSEGDNGGSNAILSMRFPSWALFDGWWEDPGFVANPDAPKKCITVSPDWDWEKRNENGTYFYTEDDRIAILTARQEERDDPQKYKVERRGHFAEVIDAYLIPEMVDRMFMGRPYNARDDKGNISVGFNLLRTNWIDSTYEHRYRAHLDPSSTTAGFGFALAHTERMGIGEGAEAQEHVVFDIIKRWNPRDFADNVIDWEPILEELVHYCEVFRPVSLSFDQHQSAWPIQWLKKELRKRGITEVAVFEKTANSQGNWNRAEIFRTALYQGLIHAPADTADTAYAGLELKFLQEIKSGRTPRVEKQDEGPIQTKDMADCMMEVVEACIGNLIAIGDRDSLGVTALRSGAPGGYQIGGFVNGQSERAAQLSSLYSRRHGEQSFGGRGGSSGGSNPARRPFGGRPMPRKLR